MTSMMGFEDNLTIDDNPVVLFFIRDNLRRPCRPRSIL